MELFQKFLILNTLQKTNYNKKILDKKIILFVDVFFFQAKKKIIK